MADSYAVARKSRPYVMRGQPRLQPRPTIVDAPDPRINAVFVTKLSPAAVRALTRDKALDPRFRAVDRYLWRWSVSQGSMLPISAAEAEALPISRPTPLADDEAVLVDQTVIRSPSWAQEFVFLWFRSDRTTEEIAAKLACRVRAVYDERRLVLAYFLGRFTALGITIPSFDY